MKKKHIAALLSALVIPGAGQLYSRQIIEGAAFMAASAALVAAMLYKTMDAALSALAMSPDELSGSLLPIVEKVTDSNRGFYGIISFIFLVIWLAGIIDAWVSGSGEPVGQK